MPAWNHTILLNAVDITAITLSGASVDEAENVSGVADIVYRPASGVQDSDGLIGQTLTVDVNVGLGAVRIFSGRVIRATWDQKERIYRVRGSNRIQEHFRSLGSTANVLAALPGATYSEALFGEPPDDLWEYAQRCMETLEQDVHMDRADTLEIADWAAKGTADVSLLASKIHNGGTFRLDRPDLDETINQVVIEYQYRVQRWKTRTHDISWTAWQNNTDIVNWCSWFSGPAAGYQFPPLPIDLGQAVLLGGSWSVPSGMPYSSYPPADNDACGSGNIWVRPEGPDQFAFTAQAKGYRSFSQALTETYTLTVSATAAQTLYGTTVTDGRSGSNSVEADPDWPPDRAQPPDGTWLVDAIGDAYQDQEDETVRVNDLQTGYQWAARRIRGQQRMTNLVVQTDLDPTLTLLQTVEVNAFDLQAKGKTRRLRFVLDSAAPYVEMSIALSRGNGGTTTPWVVPARPDTTDPGYPAPPSSTSIGTYVGGTPDAATAPVPDERLGWITNVESWICLGTPEDPCPDPDQYYDSVFRVEWPEIEDAAAQERKEAAPSSWDLAVPHDTLILG